MPSHPAALRLGGVFGGAETRVGCELEINGLLFRPAEKKQTGMLEKCPNPGSVYGSIVAKDGRRIDLSPEVKVGRAILCPARRRPMHLRRRQISLIQESLACERFNDAALRSVRHTARG